MVYEFVEKFVDGYMTRAVKTVTRDVTMRELNDMFSYDDFNAYPVIEDSQVIGLVTKLDFLKCFAFTLDTMVPRYEDLMKRTVSEVMTDRYIYAQEKTRITRVLQLMVEHRIRSIPVIDADQRLMGIISREDVMRALRDATGGKLRPN